MLNLGSWIIRWCRSLGLDMVLCDAFYCCVMAASLTSLAYPKLQVHVYYKFRPFLALRCLFYVSLDWKQLISCINNVNWLEKVAFGGMVMKMHCLLQRWLLLSSFWYLLTLPLCGPVSLEFVIRLSSFNYMLLS